MRLIAKTILTACLELGDLPFIALNIDPLYATVHMRRRTLTVCGYLRSSRWATA